MGGDAGVPPIAQSPVRVESVALTCCCKRLSSAPAGVAIISMDMYNDGTKVIDDNFDGGREGQQRIRERIMRGRHGLARAVCVLVVFAVAWTCTATGPRPHAQLPNAHLSPRRPSADPRLTDYDLLLKNLADLRDGKEVEVRVCARVQRPVGGGARGSMCGPVDALNSGHVRGFRDSKEVEVRVCACVYGRRRCVFVRAFVLGLSGVQGALHAQGPSLRKAGRSGDAAGSRACVPERTGLRARGRLLPLCRYPSSPYGTA